MKRTTTVPELAGRVHADFQPDLHHATHWTLVRLPPVPGANVARISGKLLGRHQ